MSKEREIADEIQNEIDRIATKHNLTVMRNRQEYDHGMVRVDVILKLPKETQP